MFNFWNNLQKQLTFPWYSNFFDTSVHEFQMTGLCLIYCTAVESPFWGISLQESTERSLQTCSRAVPPNSQLHSAWRGWHCTSVQWWLVDKWAWTGKELILEFIGDRRCMQRVGYFSLFLKTWFRFYFVYVATLFSNRREDQLTDQQQHNQDWPTD